MQHELQVFFVVIDFTNLGVIVTQEELEFLLLALRDKKLDTTDSQKQKMYKLTMVCVLKSIYLIYVESIH